MKQMRILTLLAVLLTATLTYAQDNIVFRNGDELAAKVLEVNQSDLKYRKAANPDGPVYSIPLRDVLLIRYANGTKDSFGGTSPSAVAPSPNSPALAESTPTGLGKLRYHRSLFSRYYTGTGGQRIGLSDADALFAGQADARTAFGRGRSLRTWSVVTGLPALALIGVGSGLLIADYAGNGGRNGRMGQFGRPDRDADPNTNMVDNNRDRRGHGAAVGAAVVGTGVLLGVASVWLDHRATVQFRRAANRYNNQSATSLRFTPSRQTLGIGAVLTF